MSTHLHFGIVTADPDRGPATLFLANPPLEAGDGHPEVALPLPPVTGSVTALFVDRGSWQVWAEPPDEEDPHDTLHVVAEFSEPHLAARVRSHLVDGIPQWCRVVDVAVLTDSTDWEIVHGTLVFNGSHDGPCYVIPSLARALDT